MNNQRRTDRADFSAEGHLPSPSADASSEGPEQATTSELPEEYRTLFELLPDPVWIDRDHRIIFVNSATLFLLGATGADQVLGHSPLDFIHPDYHGLIRKRIKQAMETGARMPVIEERLVRFDGVEVWVEVNASRVDMPFGSVILAMFRNITERKHADEAQSFVMDLIERTGALTGAEAVIHEAATMVGNRMHVNRCIYAEVTGNGDTLLVHPDFCRDAATVAGVRSVLSFLPGAMQQLIVGQPVSVNDTAKDPLTARFYDADFVDLCGAFAAVPVMKRECLTSILVVHSAEPRKWTRAELAILRTVAERIWLAVEGARLRQREHFIAATLQRFLLEMPEVDAFPGLLVHTEYAPALAEADVGGDFLDVFAVDKRRVALVVGDVSGKGLPAAARTAETRYVLRVFLRESSDLDVTLARVTSVLIKSYDLDDSKDSDGFICLSVAVIDTETGDFSAAAAGSEPPIVVRASGRVDALDTGGPPLAIIPEACYVTARDHLGYGDILVMATDGITEARRGTEMFGLDGLMRAAARGNRVSSLDQVARRILDSALTFAGSFRDDVALLLASRR